MVGYEVIAFRERDYFAREICSRGRMGWDGRERELPFIIKLRFGLVYKVPFPLAIPAGSSRRFPSVVYPVMDLSFIQSKVVDSFRESFPGESCGEPRGKEPRGILRGRECILCSTLLLFVSSLSTQTFLCTDLFSASS